MVEGRADPPPAAVLLGWEPVLFVVYVVPTPWARHIGDQFTPSERWDGYAARGLGRRIQGHLARRGAADRRHGQLVHRGPGLSRGASPRAISFVVHVGLRCIRIDIDLEVAVVE